MPDADAEKLVRDGLDRALQDAAAAMYAVLLDGLAAGNDTEAALEARFLTGVSLAVHAYGVGLRALDARP